MAGHQVARVIRGAWALPHRLSPPLIGRLSGTGVPPKALVLHGRGCPLPGQPVPRPGGRPSSAPLGRERGGKRWAPLVSTFQMSTYGLFVSGMWVVLQPKVFLLWKLIFLKVRQSNLSLSLTLCFQAASWGMRPVAQTWCFCYTSYTQFLEGDVASPLI